MRTAEFLERVAALEEARSVDRKIAPFYPSSVEVIEHMLDLASLEESDVLLDVGSGDGRVLVQACYRLVHRAIGVEIEPSLVRASREVLYADPRCVGRAEVREGDFAGADLSEATVIIVYMGPAGTWDAQKYLTTLSPSVRIICHDYPFIDWPPAEEVGGVHVCPTADGSTVFHEAPYRLYRYSTADITSS